MELLAGSDDHGAMTKLEKTLKRELKLKRQSYVLTIDPDGFKLTKKGARKGVAIRWEDLVSGDAAMAIALQASVGKL
jgi:ribosomal protein S6E (S10)